MRLGYLGPEGTFSEQAAILYAPEADFVPYPSIRGVAEAVGAREIDQGVVPIENSLHGSVIDVLDFLIRTDRTRIKYELAIPIEQCLILAPGADRRAVEVIYSHPQALGQCQNFLAGEFPDVELVASLSTAGSVTDMLESDRPAAAIAPFRAAEIHGAEVAERGIQDNRSNVTRFVALAPEDSSPTGHDKTSLAFWYASDAPGTLYETLGIFSTRGINLTKIESRPTGESLGEYVFLVDIEGHRLDAIVAGALEELSKHTSELKIFGSYPMLRDETA